MAAPPECEWVIEHHNIKTYCTNVCECLSVWPALPPATRSSYGFTFGSGRGGHLYLQSSDGPWLHDQAVTVLYTGIATALSKLCIPVVLDSAVFNFCPKTKETLSWHFHKIRSTAGLNSRVHPPEADWRLDGGRCIIRSGQKCKEHVPLWSDCIMKS